MKELILKRPSSLIRAMYYEWQTLFKVYLGCVYKENQQHNIRLREPRILSIATTVEYNISDRIEEDPFVPTKGTSARGQYYSIAHPSRESTLLKSTESDACGAQYPSAWSSSPICRRQLRLRTIVRVIFAQRLFSVYLYLHTAEWNSALVCDKGIQLWCSLFHSIWLCLQQECLSKGAIYIQIA